MEQLKELVGVERSLEGVCQVLCSCTNSLRPPVVGALHVTCADESETECAAAFQRSFVRYFLPALKFAHHSAFRIANLGAQYEWGAIRIAEDHFATDASQNEHKLLIAKVNAHVGVDGNESAACLGTMRRYGRQSHACGALHALLHGSRQPFAEHLRDAFTSEGRDRLAVLTDENKIDPAYRLLLAAIISARLQARKITLDIQDYRPATPTLYLVVPCVTLNRPGRDTEIVCGYYTADCRGQNPDVTYFGLGDDPAAYRINHEKRRLAISDDHVGAARQARNHRALVLKNWQHLTRQRSPVVNDDRLKRFRRDMLENKHRHHHHSRALLRALLPVLAEVAPVPAAVLLFAYGAAGIHHAFRVHKMAQKLEGSEEARKILREIHDKVDDLPPDQAEAMIELLMNQYHT